MHGSSDDLRKLSRATIFVSIVVDFGDVAQLGERRVRNAKVESSILFISTNKQKGGVFCGPFVYWWNQTIEVSTVRESACTKERLRAVL